MQFFLAQVEQGKDTVCVNLRASAVNKKSENLIALNMEMDNKYEITESF
jgi:hypothetical protein